MQQELGIALQHLFYPLSAISVHLQCEFGLCKNEDGHVARWCQGQEHQFNCERESIHHSQFRHLPGQEAEPTQTLSNPSSLFPQELPKPTLHNHHTGLRQSAECHIPILLVIPVRRIKAPEICFATCSTTIRCQQSCRELPEKQEFQGELSTSLGICCKAV